jgi:hypothetical protein
VEIDELQRELRIVRGQISVQRGLITLVETKDTNHETDARIHSMEASGSLKSPNSADTLRNSSRRFSERAPSYSNSPPSSPRCVWFGILSSRALTEELGMPAGWPCGWESPKRAAIQ